MFPSHALKLRPSGGQKEFTYRSYFGSRTLREVTFGSLGEESRFDARAWQGALKPLPKWLGGSRGGHQLQPRPQAPWQQSAPPWQQSATGSNQRHRGFRQERRQRGSWRARRPWQEPTLNCSCWVQGLCLCLLRLALWIGGRCADGALGAASAR